MSVHFKRLKNIELVLHPDFSDVTVIYLTRTTLATMMLTPCAVRGMKSVSMMDRLVSLPTRASGGIDT